MQKLNSLTPDGILMFLDLHGHSIKKNVFLYGPEYPIYHKNYYLSKLYAKMISKKC